jgi:phosphatidylinositol-3-phosphatase
MRDRLAAWSIAIIATALAACARTASTPTPMPAFTPTVSPTFVPTPLATQLVAPTAGTTITITPSPSTQSIFNRVYLIVLENKEYSDIVGSAAAPYLNNLIAQYGLASNYTGVAHPSEPNYFALFSGSTEGATDDGVYNLAGSNLADQLEAHGRTWRVFEENAPTECFAGEVGVNGEDGVGLYARKHNPAISFADIRGAAPRCANITNFTRFDPAAADYALIVPNLCHDMHDCSVAIGDTFLSGFVPRIISSRAWQDGGVMFITWDEGTTNVGDGGHIPLLVISKRVAKGFQSPTAHNHYSLVRTIEEAWGLGCLNEACKANTLDEFFPK